MNVNVCEFTFHVCHKHRHTFACTSQLFHSKSISFQDTNVVTTHMVATGNPQRLGSIGGVARAYRAQAPTVTGLTLRRGPPSEGSSRNCHFRTARSHDLPMKSPKPEYLCGNFHVFSTLAPTFLNLYRPNNTCLKSLQQSVLSSGFTIT